MADDGFKPQIAIIGLGLLGTSLAMALKARGHAVIGWTRRREIRQWAVDQGILDHTAEPAADVLRQADLTVLCLPIPQIMNFLREHARDWRPGSVVTDIGSVKECIVAAAEAALADTGVCFVGSHPMAGTEQSGPEHAFPELYAHAQVFAVRTALTTPEAFAAVRQLWETVGTQVVPIEAREHDLLVAHTSHVPHLLAYALSLTVLGCDEPDRQLRYAGCANGFRDTSRISSSSPQMWREILEHNRPAVLAAMAEFENCWQKLKDELAAGDFTALEQTLTRGKNLRDAWLDARSNRSTLEQSGTQQ